MQQRLKISFTVNDLARGCSLQANYELAIVLGRAAWILELARQEIFQCVPIDHFEATATCNLVVKPPRDRPIS